MRFVTFDDVTVLELDMPSCQMPDEAPLSSPFSTAPPSETSVDTYHNDEDALAAVLHAEQSVEEDEGAGATQAARSPHKTRPRPPPRKKYDDEAGFLSSDNEGPIIPGKTARFAPSESHRELEMDDEVPQNVLASGMTSSSRSHRRAKPSLLPAIERLEKGLERLESLEQALEETMRPEPDWEEVGCAATPADTDSSAHADIGCSCPAGTRPAPPPPPIASLPATRSRQTHGCSRTART